MIGQIFKTVFFNPILNLLILFYTLFLYLKVPGAFGFSIMALTLVIQFLMLPLLRKNKEFTQKMAELRPQLDSLSKKHKSDPKRLREEQARLYKETGFNPAAGCLLPVIQFPIIIALFQVLQLLLKNGSEGKVIAEINKALYFPALKITSIDPHFFVYNLAVSPRDGGTWYYYIVPVVTVIFSYFQFKSSSASISPSAKVSEGHAKKGEKNIVKASDKDKKGSNQEDFQKVMNAQMKYMFPLLFGWISFTFPVGLALYWNVSSIFSIIQYRQTK